MTGVVNVFLKIASDADQFLSIPHLEMKFKHFDIELQNFLSL